MLKDLENKFDTVDHYYFKKNPVKNLKLHLKTGSDHTCKIDDILSPFIVSIRTGDRKHIVFLKIQF